MMATKWNGILLLFLATFLMIPSAVTSLDIAYCSSQNTGSDFDAVPFKYQSNGECSNTCVAKYAFAILQGKNCWCSNYIPATTKSTASCNQNCPGYPADKCGNTREKLFGYFALDEKPSGTATGGGGSGGGPTSMTTIVSTTSTAGPETETVTVVPSSLESLTTLSTSSSTTAPPTTTDSEDVSVTTRAGEVVTITVPNGQPAETAGSDGEKQDDGSSLGGGAIAGIIIGILAIVGGTFGIWIWFFCARRRREEEDHNPESHLDPTVPHSALYNGNHRSNRSSQMSMLRNNRFSVPAFTDNRMKKDAVIYGNGARESNVSLQDNQDYTRPVLRLANPDP